MDRPRRGGFLVSRSGRYKWIIVAGLAAMSVGILLFTGLAADIAHSKLWLSMFVLGIGIGPTLSVFTIVVQTSVPPGSLGEATGNLTFLRQVGGSVGLAIAGTTFADSFSSRLGPKLTGAGVPPEQIAMVGQFPSGGGDLTQVSEHALAEQLAQVPPLRGFVDQIVAGVYGAFSLAIADAAWLSLMATFIALIVVIIGLRGLPLRGMGDAPADAAHTGAKAIGDALDITA